MADMTDFTFADWGQAFPFKESKPLRDDTLSTDTCFIRTSATSPLPAASHWETWEWTDDPRTLLGYTVNVVLPDMIATWFFEQSDGDRLPSRDYLALARDRGSLVNDIPIVEETLSIVEAIPPDLPRDEIVAGLARASHMWNERFGRTRTWDLSFDVFPDLDTAADAFWDRYYENSPPAMDGNELTKAEWMEVCRNVTSDREAQDFVVNSFSEDFF